MASAVARKPASIPPWAATGIRSVPLLPLSLLLAVGAHAADVPDWDRRIGPV